MVLHEADGRVVDDVGEHVEPADDGHCAAIAASLWRCARAVLCVPMSDWQASTLATTPLVISRTTACRVAWPAQDDACGISGTALPLLSHCAPSLMMERYASLAVSCSNRFTVSPRRHSCRSGHASVGGGEDAVSHLHDGEQAGECLVAVRLDDVGQCVEHGHALHLLSITAHTHTHALVCTAPSGLPPARLTRPRHTRTWTHSGMLVCGSAGRAQDASSCCTTSSCAPLCTDATAAACSPQSHSQRVRDQPSNRSSVEQQGTPHPSLTPAPRVTARLVLLSCANNCPLAGDGRARREPTGESASSLLLRLLVPSGGRG